MAALSQRVVESVSRAWRFGVEGSMSFRFAEVVGRYRLQLSDELLAFIEQRFVEPAPLWNRDRVRSEALAEALAAELVIEADGTVSSRAGEREFYRARLRHVDGEPSLVGLALQYEFDKAPGVNVRLLFSAPNTLTAFQPDKPEMTFLRARPR
jgi:hypothetical protein